MKRTTLPLVMCGPIYSRHVELECAATLADLHEKVSWQLLCTKMEPEPEMDADPMIQFYLVPPEPEPEPEPEPAPASGLFVILCGRLNCTLAPSAPGLEAFTPLESLGVRDGDVLNIQPVKDLAKPAAQRLLTPRKRSTTSRGTPTAAPEEPQAPDWALVVSEVGVATGMQRICAYQLAHLEKTPDDAEERVAAGAKAVSELVTTLVQAGVTAGKDESRPFLERFCGHVQTTYFDGVTAEQNGVELRNRCKQLNVMIESLVRTQNFQ